jgi:hypothetical protein
VKKIQRKTVSTSTGKKFYLAKNNGKNIEINLRTGEQHELPTPMICS